MSEKEPVPAPTPTDAQLDLVLGTETALTPLNVLPVSLRKAVAAVHIYPVRGSYTLLLRKVFNGVIALTMHRWKQLSAERQAEILEKRMVPRFSATVGELRKAVKASPRTHNNMRYYEALAELRDIPFQFDVMRDGRWWKNHGSAIAQVSTPRDGADVVEWEFLPDVLEMLVRPMPYVRIDLELAHSLNSAPALALYENTYRYINTPNKRTAALTVGEWARLLVGPGKYEDAYKEFNRTVLKPAIDVLAKNSLCPITVIPHEIKSGGRKVSHLWFEVALKEKLGALTELTRSMDQKLFQALRKLGVSESMIGQLLITHDEIQLWQQYELTRKAMSRQSIENPAGFFVTAVQQNFRDGVALPLSDAAGTAQASAASKAEQEAARARRTAQEKKEREARELEEARSAFEEHRMQRMREVFDELSEDAQEDFVIRWREMPEAQAVSVRRAFLAKGMASPVVSGVFFNWLKNNAPELLTRPEDTDLAAFVKKRAATA